MQDITVNYALVITSNCEQASLKRYCDITTVCFSHKIVLVRLIAPAVFLDHVPLQSPFLAPFLGHV